MSLIRATSLEAAVIEGIAYGINTFRTLNNNEILNLTVEAPSTPPTISLAFDVDPEGQLLVEVFRATTLNVTPGGTILTLINANEASGNVASTIVRENPTIDTDGNLVSDVLLGSGKKNTVIGQGGRVNIIPLAVALGTTLIRLESGLARNTVNFSITVIEET